MCLSYLVVAFYVVLPLNCCVNQPAFKFVQLSHQTVYEKMKVIRTSVITHNYLQYSHIGLKPYTNSVHDRDVYSTVIGSHQSMRVNKTVPI